MSHNFFQFLIQLVWIKIGRYFLLTGDILGTPKTELSKREKNEFIDNEFQAKVCTAIYLL